MRFCCYTTADLLCKLLSCLANSNDFFLPFAFQRQQKKRVVLIEQMLPQKQSLDHAKFEESVVVTGT